VLIDEEDGDPIDAPSLRCPFGRVGDRVYVRETWHPETNGTDAGDHYLRVRYACDGFERHISYNDTPSSWIIPKAAIRGNVPSLLMPKFVARTWGTITSVRVERLRDISEADAKAEGVEPTNGHPVRGAFFGTGPSYREGFMQLWADLYGAESFAANPWVWVVQWEREIKGAV